MIFEEGPSATLTQRLRQYSERVVRVTPATEFEHVSDLEFGIDSESCSDYRELVERLKADGLIPARIVYLWSQAGRRRSNFYGLLFLSKALAAVPQLGPLEIVAVSCGLYDVTGSEPLQPDAALLLGPCKVIPQEWPHIRCRNVDLASSNDATTLLHELIGGSDEPVVAYRGGHRWVQGFEKLPLAAPQSGVLRDGGTYLITGGLGDVGMALAETIARVARANLVLVGRSEIPARHHWGAWLAANGHRGSVEPQTIANPRA